MQTHRIQAAMHAVFVTLAFAATQAHAQHYDATRAFSEQHDTNPNGVWSYGYLDAGTATFHPFSTYFNEGWRIAWDDPTHYQVGVPIFMKNVGSDTRYGVLPGQLALHPGFDRQSSPFDDAAVIRFTAPSAGNYNVKLSLFSGDTGETEAWVIKNHNLSRPVMHFASTTGNPQWEQVVTLPKKGTLEIVVGSSSDSFGSDTTPLSLIVNKIPAN